MFHGRYRLKLKIQVLQNMCASPGRRTKRQPRNIGKHRKNKWRGSGRLSKRRIVTLVIGLLQVLVSSTEILLKVHQLQLAPQLLRNGTIGMWPKLPEAKKADSDKRTSQALGLWQFVTCDTSSAAEGL